MVMSKVDWKLLHKNYLNYLRRLENDHFFKLNNRLTIESQCDKEKVLEIIKIKLLVNKSIKVGTRYVEDIGDKGMVSMIVPKEDMPFMADGTPIDIILTPLGVPSRMNIGQILKANFGLISYKLEREFKDILDMYNITNDDHVLQSTILNFVRYIQISPDYKGMVLTMLTKLSHGVKLSCPLFDSSTESCLKTFNNSLLIDPSGKIQLYDGITGMSFVRKTTIGVIFVFKLNHLVDDKNMQDR